MTPAQRKQWTDLAKAAPPCPKCKSVEIVPIAWGVEAFEASLDSDLVKYGGSPVVVGKSPTWHCRACGEDFGTFEFEGATPGTEIFID